MTRNGNGYGPGRSNMGGPGMGGPGMGGRGMGGRGMGGRGNGQCLRDETDFGRGSGQGRRRCRFEEGDSRWGFAGLNVIGTHPFASAISRIEAAIEGLKRQIDELRQKS